MPATAAGLYVNVINRGLSSTSTMRLSWDVAFELLLLALRLFASTRTKSINNMLSWLDLDTFAGPF